MKSNMNEQDFLDAGFIKDETDPQFKYYKPLVSQECIDDNQLAPDDIPSVVFGDTGINKGFAIYTGQGSFVWFNASNPTEAADFASKITAIEEA